MLKDVAGGRKHCKEIINVKKATLGARLPLLHLFLRFLPPST